MTIIRLGAPAKVNLSLHVVGRRDDGYHLLDSLVAFAGVGDRLTMEPADDLTLTVDGPTAPSLELGGGTADNIVLRAARLLAEAAGVRAGARIHLTKRLPVAAGIGGGSADAAATLRGLCRLWGLDGFPLGALAARLGADVPVCLRGRAVRMTGIGEGLADLPALPPAWLVLVNPGVPLSTPAVFAARSGAFSPPPPPLEPAALAETLAATLAWGHRNDLTAAAITLAPEVGTVLAALSATPGCLLARMSGSGATCWGLFASAETAQAAASALRTAQPTWWTAPAPLLADAATFDAAP